MGEAAGRVSMNRRGPERHCIRTGSGKAPERSRVLESCIAEVEARPGCRDQRREGKYRRADRPAGGRALVPDIRSVLDTATLLEAGQQMEQWKTGSLLVTNTQSYVGFIDRLDSGTRSGR